jgi:isocitrate dehydrogenase (NAD+)
MPGDGCGPDLVAATCRVLAAAGAGLSWDRRELGVRAVAQGRPPLDADVLASIRSNGVALKGPVSTPPGMRSVNIGLRRALDLYVQVRPVRSRPGVPGARPGVTLSIVRETTEDLYAGIELAPDDPLTTELTAGLAARGVRLAPGTALALKPTSYAAAARAARFAARHAIASGARRLTVVHKAAVMPATDGLFRTAAVEAAREVAPGLAVDDASVDAVAAALVRHPQDFGVLVMPNLYGDVLSDLAGALVGGVGLAPGANHGEGAAVFEAVHGTAPRYVGQDRANPLGVLLSGVLLLRHVGLDAVADRVEDAVERVLVDGTCVTADLRAPDDPRPAVGTRAMTDAVVQALG